MEAPVCWAIFHSTERREPASDGVLNLSDNGVGISPAIGVISVISFCPNCVHTNTESEFFENIGKGILFPIGGHVVDGIGPRERLPVSIAFGNNISPNPPRYWASKKEVIMVIHLRATQETGRVGDIRNSILSAQPLLDGEPKDKAGPWNVLGVLHQPMPRYLRAGRADSCPRRLC